MLRNYAVTSSNI